MGGTVLPDKPQLVRTNRQDSQRHAARMSISPGFTSENCGNNEMHRVLEAHMEVRQPFDVTHHGTTVDQRNPVTTE